MIPLQTPGIISKILADNGVPYAGSIGSAIAFFMAFLAVYFAGRLVLLPILNGMMRRRKMDEHVRRPFRRIVMVVVVFVAIAVAFGFAEYGDFLTSLATIAAAATLAIGFAMQDVLRNFVAGVFIYTDEPFRVNDWIEWDDHAGIVEDISFRVTRVRSFDNELLTVPNSDLTDGVIKNPVAKDKLRLKFVFGIGYDDDIGAASDIIVDAAQSHGAFIDDPAPSVRLTELGDSYVGLQARVWIADPSRSDFVKARGEFVTDVKQRFDEAGIEIPFPQRDLTGGIELTSPAEGPDVETESDD